jgi:hypothetical protein
MTNTTAVATTSEVKADFSAENQADVTCVVPKWAINYGFFFPRWNHARSTTSTSEECAVSCCTRRDRALAASDTSYLPVAWPSELIPSLPGTYERTGRQPRSSLYRLRRYLFGSIRRSAMVENVCGWYTESILRGAGGVSETGPASVFSSSNSPAVCMPTPRIRRLSMTASFGEGVSCVS